MKITPETRRDHEIRYGLLQIILKADKNSYYRTKYHIL
jgi:hypothetical protein